MLIALLTFQCGDKLDIQPANTVGLSQAVNTSGDVEALLVGAFAQLGNTDLYGGNMLRDVDLLGDAGDVFWDGTFVAPGEIWAKSMLITNDQAEETWLEAYSAINRANTVLANIDKVTADKKDRVEGEAKFIRGTVYFELARTYGRTWMDGNPATNLAVPLVLQPADPNNLGINLPRNTVAEVYTAAIADLTDAEALLPAKNGIFSTRYAAAAILSRIYLMQNNYAEALAAANRVITSGEFALTTSFADAFGKSSTGSTSRSSNGMATVEDVFAIQVTNQAGVNSLNTFYDPSGRSDIIIEDAHAALYENGDFRGTFFQISGGNRFTRKFTNRFANVSIVRLAEMLLTRAEANLRLGSSVGATPLADINTIRARVGLSNLGAVTIDDILLERKLELAFEGHLLHDLKRTQRSIGTRPFSDPKLIFPIPQREMIINPALVQNEAYTN